MARPSQSYKDLQIGDAEEDSVVDSTDGAEVTPTDEDANTFGWLGTIGVNRDRGSAGASAKSDSALELDINSISYNPNQPRKTIDPDNLKSLANTMRVSGVLQPILVKPDGEDRYTIVAGERRWRAAQMAGLTTVPAVIRHVSPTEERVIQLIENLGREDVPPLEEAAAIDQLLSDYKTQLIDMAKQSGEKKRLGPQRALATMLGKSEKWVSYRVKLAKVNKDEDHPVKRVAENHRIADTDCLVDLNRLYELSEKHAKKFFDSPDLISRQTVRSAIEHVSQEDDDTATQPSTKKTKLQLTVKIGRREGRLLPSKDAKKGHVWVDFDGEKEEVDCRDGKMKLLGFQ